MTRYIDLDKLAEMIEAKADTLIEGKEAFLYIKKWLDFLPTTADVVPRSEVEEIVKFKDMAYAELKSLYMEAKQEVAREIFDNMISDTNLAISYVKNTKFYTEEIRKVKLECYRDILGYFAELKKKYKGE